MEDAIARIEALERSATRHRIAIGVLGAGLTLLVVGGFGQSVSGDREVRAQRFVVVDAAGKPRAELGLFPYGDGAITINDPAGDAAKRLEAEANPTPGLRLYGEGGARCVDLGLMKGDGPRFIMSKDPRTGSGIWLDCTNGVPGISIKAKEWRYGTSIGLGGLTIQHPKGAILQARVHSEGPYVSLRESAKRESFRAGASVGDGNFDDESWK